MHTFVLSLSCSGVKTPLGYIVSETGPGVLTGKMDTHFRRTFLNSRVADNPALYIVMLIIRKILSYSVFEANINS